MYFQVLYLKKKLKKKTILTINMCESYERLTAIGQFSELNKRVAGS